MEITLKKIFEDFFDEAIKAEGYGPIIRIVKRVLFPPKKYENRLNQLISLTKKEYVELNSIKLDLDKTYFYQSQILFKELSSYILFKSKDFSKIKKQLEDNPKIVPPTEEELTQFFGIFLEKVKSDKELKELYVEENYKAEIFEVSQELNSIRAKLEEIGSDVKRISNKLDPSETPILAKEFIDRKELEILIDKIDSSNVLLLTGVSFCGKSQLAKKIAKHFIEEGYDYINRSDLGEAERILRSMNEKPRVFVLEDPFGHSLGSEEPDNWKKVEEIIQNLNPSDKLIVTSRIEILKSIRKVSSIIECSFPGNEWSDLTAKDKGFLNSIWQKMCKEAGTPENIKESIESYINETPDEYILQPGQLSYLAKMPAEKLKHKELEELLHLARQDAKGMSLELQSRGDNGYKVFVALGLGATTNLSIGLAELTYILSNDESLPSLREKGVFIKSKSSNRNDVFPKYETQNSLGHEYLDEISFLQTRGFINVSGEKIWFTHPTYKEASTYLMLSDTISSMKNFQGLIKKEVACLNPNTTFNTIKQLKFIYKTSKNEDVRKNIRDLIYNVFLNSIFPATTDSSLSFLLETIEDLDDSAKAKITQYIDTAYSPSIAWHYDIPFYHSSSLDFFDSLETGMSENPNIDQTIDKLNNSDSSLTVHELWKYLQNLKYNSTLLLPNEEGSLHVFNSPEAFIREEFAFQLLRRQFPKAQSLQKAIFTDEHPSVIFEGVKGALMGWTSYSDDERKFAKDYIIEAFDNPMVIVRSNNLITSFAIDYGGESLDWDRIAQSEKGSLWSLWAELLIKLLNGYPKYLRIPNSGRFDVTMRDSIEYISNEENLEICKAYLDWIVKQLKKGFLDTYEMAIISHLIRSTKDNPDSRFDLFKGIFSVNDTGFLLYSISWSLSYWEKLTIQEQNIILDLLSAKRADQRWIKAVSLTQEPLPKEIIELLLRDPSYFDRPTEEIVKSLDSSLLADCLSVFFGHPYQLGHLGVGHSGRDIWLPIVNWILRNEYSVGFNICLREMIGEGTNGFGSRWHEDGHEIWSDLCQKSTNKKRLAQRLIISTSETNCSIHSTKKLWKALINAYSDDIEELVELILLNIVPLQTFHPEDLLDFFGSNFISKYLFPHLKLDQSLVILYNRINKEDFDSIEDVNFEIDKCLELSKSERITLGIVKQRLESLVKGYMDKYPRLVELEKLDSFSNQEAWDEMKKFDDDYELNDWSYLSKHKLEI